MRALPALATSALVLLALPILGCGTSRTETAVAVPEASVGAAATTRPAAPIEGEPGDDDHTTRPQPHPDIPTGTRLTAYVGPRFVTGESFVPEARTVLADETGRVRALLKGPPPEGTYPVVTLPGALAVAGLHDAHLHIQGLGQGRDQVQLLSSKSAAEAKKRVVIWAAKHPDAAVVRGRGWDQSLFPGEAWPTWRDLEGADPKGRPILLSRVDGHAAWANKKTLELAGITRDTPDPAGGKILRDARGEPTGVLIDNAIDLATAKLPAPTPADVERWLVAGMEACAEAGLVAVHDMGMSVDAARVLMRLDEEGRLPVRVFVYLDGTEPAAYDLLATYAPPQGPEASARRLRLMGVKLYADGAMGSRGAALLEDYADDVGNKGLLLTEPAVLAERVALVHQKGFAAAVHAIGDRGNRVVLDVMKASPAPRGARDRIEHAQLVAPMDFERFAAERVIASMQPTHATSDMRWAEERVGPERVKGAYAWRTMLARGVRLAFGSDAPVEDVRPQLGLYAAITRQDADSQPPAGFLPAERLSQAEALAAFAAGAAWAVGMEQHLGALTPGMLFDVSLFADDAARQTDAGDAKAWLKTRPVGIVVGGVLRSTTAARGKN